MLVSVHLLHVLVQGGVSSGCHIGYKAVGDVHKIVQTLILLKLTLKNNAIDFYQQLLT